MLPFCRLSTAPGNGLIVGIFGTTDDGFATVPTNQVFARVRSPAVSTCTAAEGLDAETFRGFHLAGELFLLISFFIEPNVRPSPERVRKLTLPSLARRSGRVRMDVLAGADFNPSAATWALTKGAALD